MAQQARAPPSQEILDDLCSRFVLNAPEEDMQSFERMLFLVEQAHWFYEDQVAEGSETLRSLSLKEFAALMFRHSPALRQHANKLPDIYTKFTTYKQAVPVMGAIILDPTMRMVLLVRGYQARAAWSFPRGKISKDETDAQCAVREVMEETGFDISGKFSEDDSLQITMGAQRIRLFIVPDVDERTTLFATQTRKEISEIAWHLLEAIPESSNQRTEGGHRYFMVWPFLGQLKVWIARRRRGASGAPSASASGSGTKGRKTTAATTATAAAVAQAPGPSAAPWAAGFGGAGGRAGGGPWDTPTQAVAQGPRPGQGGFTFQQLALLGMDGGGDVTSSNSWPLSSTRSSAVPTSVAASSASSSAVSSSSSSAAAAAAAAAAALPSRSASAASVSTAKAGRAAGKVPATAVKQQPSKRPPAADGLLVASAAAVGPVAGAAKPAAAGAPAAAAAAAIPAAIVGMAATAAVPALSAASKPAKKRGKPGALQAVAVSAGEAAVQRGTSLRDFQLDSDSIMASMRAAMARVGAAA